MNLFRCLLVVVGILAVLAPLARGDAESAALLMRLTARVSEDGINLDHLERALKIVCGRRDIKYRIDMKAFAAAGIDLENRKVQSAPVRDLSLAHLLQRILDQAQATYRIENGILVIVPRSR